MEQRISRDRQDELIAQADEMAGQAVQAVKGGDWERAEAHAQVAQALAAVGTAIASARMVSLKS